MPKQCPNAHMPKQCPRLSERKPERLCIDPPFTAVGYELSCTSSSGGVLIPQIINIYRQKVINFVTLCNTKNEK